MYFSVGRLAGQEKVCFVICPWLSRERGGGGGDAWLLPHRLTRRLYSFCGAIVRATVTTGCTIAIGASPQSNQRTDKKGDKEQMDWVLVAMLGLLGLAACSLLGMRSDERVDIGELVPWNLRYKSNEMLRVINHPSFSPHRRLAKSWLAVTDRSPTQAGNHMLILPSL